MQRVTGLGGVFFKSKDPEALYAWYERHLGIKRDAHGQCTFEWRESGNPEQAGVTAWSIFKEESDYFEPTVAPFMFNYRVADLDALLVVLKEEGVWVDDRRDNSFGKFAWVKDSDGNRIELWEPPPGE